MLTSRCPTLLFHKSYRIGVSQRRAERICRWCKEMSTTKSVNTAVFEVRLSRITCVGSVGIRTGFSQPAQKNILAIHPRGSVRRIPSYVRFVLRYIASAEEIRDHMRAIRVDAQASDQRTGIGGWYPEVDVKGKPDTHDSKFAFEVTKEDFPWICQRDDTPSRVISTLEALGVLVALKLKCGEDPLMLRRRSRTVGATELPSVKKGPPNSHGD